MLSFQRAVVAAVVAVIAVVGPNPPIPYRPPVDAPISEPFRAPARPYGPGHRGVAYATAPGTAVVAAAPGEVRFAGEVAGRQWVTVAHADGIRTTYGPLATIAVAAGASVEAGDPVGTTIGPLLWTARLGAVYFDPLGLLETTVGVHLVPEQREQGRFAAVDGTISAAELRWALRPAFLGGRRAGR